MPVLISKADNTQPQQGIIHITDVHRMLSDFRRKLNLDCIDPSRNPIQKRFYFQIDIKKLEEILKKSGDKTTIRINMSLNLPGQLDCSQTESIENNLSIIVCGIDPKGNPLLNDGDIVLVEGFIDHEKYKTSGDPCCVQGKPMLDV
jgi:hypothetical protein